jgi:hypothetical protein
VITAIVLNDLPPDIGLEECRAHFTKIAPDFLENSGSISTVRCGAGRTGPALWRANAKKRTDRRSVRSGDDPGTAVRQLNPQARTGQVR